MASTKIIDLLTELVAVTERRLRRYQMAVSQDPHALAQDDLDAAEEAWIEARIHLERASSEGEA